MCYAHKALFGFVIPFFMKYFYFLSWILLCALPIRSQVLTITDVESKMPLDEVSVWSDVPSAYALSNSRGQANLGAFEGAAAIRISRLGYSSLTLSYEALRQAEFKVSMRTSGLTTQGVVVISASRWENPARYEPARIAGITRSAVQLMNPQTAADMLAQTGEVFVQKSQQGGGSPMIRGFATNRLLYSVDGVRMNTAIFRGGNIQHVISLDALSLESAEVLFGPGAALYGSDAIGAVMRFETLRPQFAVGDKPVTGGSATSRYASASNEITLHADVHVGSRKWAYLGSFTHSDFGDLRMGRHGPDEYLRPFFVQRIDSLDRVVENADPLVQTPGGYRQMNIMQKLAWRPNKVWQIGYAFHYSETSSFGRYDRLIATQNNGQPQFAVWNYGPQTWMMNMLNADYNKEHRLFNRFSLRVAQQEFGESRIDRRFQQQRLRTQAEKVQAYSFNADFEKKWSRHQLHYGLEGVWNEVRSQASAELIDDGSAVAVPDRYPRSSWRSLGLYLQYRYRIAEGFFLNSAIRATQYSLQADFTRHLQFFPFDFSQTSLTNEAVTGSLGLVYSKSERSRMYVTLNNAFRAPNVDDIGKIFEFGDAELVVPNPNLKAETAWSAEVGFNLQPLPWMRFDAGVYYTYLEDALVRRPYRVNGQDSIVFDGVLSQAFAIQNAAFARVYGVQGSLEVSSGTGFRLLSRLSWQRGEEQMDNGQLSPSRHVPPMFGLTRLSYKHRQLSMHAEAVYSAGFRFKQLNIEEQIKPELYARGADGLPFSPSWYSLNFRFQYSLSEWLNLSAGVENLSDQRYRTYSSGIAAAGRNLVVALHFRF